MSVKSGNTPACAACKYQRRRCSPDCILAPFFPASQTKAFQNAHRLFGIANIVKILKQMTTEEQKAEAMKSIKYEADARERFPVHGCYGIVQHLQSQIQEAKNELQDVYKQLNTYRRETSIPAASDISSHSPLSSNLQLGINHGSDIQLSDSTGRQTPQSLGSEIPFFFSIDEEEEYEDESRHHRHHHLHLDQNEAVEQSYYGLNGNDNNSFNNFTAPSNTYQNFQNEMFFDKQSYIETKDASESSSVTSFGEFQQPTSKNK